MLLGQDLASFHAIDRFNIVVGHPVVVQSLRISKEWNTSGVADLVTGEEGATDQEEAWPSELGIADLVHCVLLVSAKS